MSALNINGYYPLYLDEDEAAAASVTGNTTSTYIGETTYYIPEGVTYYEGSYYEPGADQEMLIFANPKVTSTWHEDSEPMLSVVYADPQTVESLTAEITTLQEAHPEYENFTILRRDQLPLKGWWAYGSWELGSNQMVINLDRAKIIAFKMIKRMAFRRSKQLMSEERLGLRDTSVLDTLATTIQTIKTTLDGSTDFTDLKTKLTNALQTHFSEEFSDEFTTSYGSGLV